MEKRDARVNVADNDVQTHGQAPFVVGGNADVQRIDGIADTA